MVTETQPFDAARYLTSVRAQAELLHDALISGDACYIAHAHSVIARVRRTTEAAGSVTRA